MNIRRCARRTIPYRKLWSIKKGKLQSTDQQKLIKLRWFGQNVYIIGGHGDARLGLGERTGKVADGGIEMGRREAAGVCWSRKYPYGWMC
jgi:hypothetical protein